MNASSRTIDVVTHKKHEEVVTSLFVGAQKVAQGLADEIVEKNHTIKKLTNLVQQLKQEQTPVNIKSGGSESSDLVKRLTESVAYAKESEMSIEEKRKFNEILGEDFFKV